MEVSFLLKLRGGMRCAVDIDSIKTGFLTKESEAEGEIRVLVVEPHRAVVIDTQDCTMMKGVYVDLSAAVHTILSRDATGEEKQWVRHTDKPMEIAQVDTTEPDAEVDGSSAKYFTPCERLPIAIDGGLPVGSVVQCRATFNWAMSIAPIMLRVTSEAEQPARRLRGIVTRVKLRADGDVNFVELKAEAVVMDGQAVPEEFAHSFFAEEILSKKDRPLGAGDAVDWFAVPGSRCAVYVTPHRTVAVDQKDEVNCVILSLVLCIYIY